METIKLKDTTSQGPDGITSNPRENYKRKCNNNFTNQGSCYHGIYQLTKSWSIESKQKSNHAQMVNQDTDQLQKQEDVPALLILCTLLYKNVFPKTTISKQSKTLQANQSL